MLVFFLLTSTVARTVTLSNLELPRDQNGDKIITGEADVLVHDGAYYLYFNNWGTCPGVNCCDSAKGCATCCFDNPPHPYLPGCGDRTNGSDPYGLYHTVQVYRTTDFASFDNLGIALPLSARPSGTEFRPHVVYNARTKLFIMWYEDRSSSQHGYTVASSPTPQGPFGVIKGNVTLPGKGRVGDYDIFVDDDGSAYHVRTGFDIVKLDDDYTGPSSHVASFSTPKSSEGPVMFKRKGKYYVLPGTGCCACVGGSSIYVEMADSVAGPWRYAGEIGSNPQKFDPHSPHNYVTNAQASVVFAVASSTKEEATYVWMGNQWNTGLEEAPPGPRNHDLLYWSVLRFHDNGTIAQFEYAENATFPM